MILLLNCVRFLFNMNTRKITNRKNLAESDDENGNYSRRSDEEWAPDGESSRNSTGIDSEHSSIIPEDEINVTFDTTTGFTLKIVKFFNQSKHPVYSLYGRLMKANVMIHRVKDRFFCLKCFNENKFKR